LFSLRTIDFIRNLSTKDALLIEELAAYVSPNFLWREADELEKCGISYEKLLELQELGVLTEVGTMTLRMNLKSSDSSAFVAAVRFSNLAVVIRHSDPTMKASCPVIPITHLGRQVLSLGMAKPHRPFVEAFCKPFQSQGFTVTIGKASNVTETRFDVGEEEQVL
jgi:hypothetical protein